MVLSTTESLVLSALRELDSQSFAATEVALRMFYLLGEVIVDKVRGEERKEGRKGGKGEGEKKRGTSLTCTLISTHVSCVSALLLILLHMQGSHFGGPKGSESPWHRMMTAVSATQGEAPMLLLRPRPLSSPPPGCHQPSLPPQAHSCVSDVL